MLLSQLCRLNAAVAICRRYRLSEDIALILMYTLMILKRSDRFHWTWIVVQKREIQYDKRWKQYKSKDHLLLYFQNNNNGKCTWKNLLYNFYFRQTAILFLYFFNFLSLFFPTLFVLVLSYLSGTCTFFFADISGRDFFSSFGHFWAELFFQVGGGVHVHPVHPPPAYAPVLNISGKPYRNVSVYHWFTEHCSFDGELNILENVESSVNTELTHLWALCS